MAEACCIAILGAESTGKTTLAAALATELANELAKPLGAHPGRALPRVTWVPELLRDWCDQHGRTPRRDEQAAIALAQHARIQSAARDHDVVVTDTTALMTAVYSQLIFTDTSLDVLAVQLHRSSVHGTLLTALDLPWVADGHQRDGPQVRAPVDRALRTLMDTHGIAYTVIQGSGAARLAHARAAVAPVLAAAGIQPLAGDRAHAPAASTAAKG